MTRLHLLVIDPQNDFVDSAHGALAVPGADRDMDRLALMVKRLKGKLADIHVTLDSHRKVDVSHPMWWKHASSGARPAPFTQITADDVRGGVWTTYNPSWRSRTLEYLDELARRGRYAHTIWPEHCLIGDEGHNVWPALSEAIHEWEENFAIAEFVTKGSNIWTEHFSAVMAEVPDPEDPKTQLNADLITSLEEADVVLLAGEARSHCLASTVRDIADNFGDPRTIEKLVLLTDATSDVGDPPGTTLFSDLGAAFLRDMTARGMKTATTADFLAL